MSIHSCDGTYEGDRSCHECGPWLELEDKIKELEDQLAKSNEENAMHRETSQRRGIELAQTRAVLAVRTVALEWIATVQQPCRIDEGGGPNKFDLGEARNALKLRASEALASTGTEELAAIREAMRALKIAGEHHSECEYLQYGQECDCHVLVTVDALHALKKYFGDGV